MTRLKSYFKYLMRLALASCIFMLVPVAPAAAQEESADEAAQAEAIARETIETMGGEEAWNETRFLSWTWLGQRHFWDKWTGDFRWERDSLTSIINTNTREGRYWIDGVEVTDPDSLEPLLDEVYRRWVNNSYWLVMPFKLLDPGVNLRYMGERESAAGEMAQVLEMTFEGVGLTPQNRYEVLVDKESRLVCEWTHWTNRDDTEPYFVRPWTDWEKYGGIMLASERGDGPLDITGIEAPEEFPEGIFEDLSF